MVERTLMAVSGVVALIFSVTAGVAYAGDPGMELLDRASQQYCEQYTRELAEFMLKEGPPADVELMENAISMLDTGEWVVSSTTLGSKAGDTPQHWIVEVRCGSASPFEDLNGDVELTYTMVLNASTGEIDQLTD